MATTVQMPSLGESVTRGIVTRWLKNEGDAVQVNEPLVEVSTDKVDTEIPSPLTGVLTKIIAHTDEEIVVGGPLGIIGAGDEVVEGFRRTESPFPIAAAPMAQLTDESAFESADGLQSYALPRYVLQRDLVGTVREPRIVIIEDGDSARLVVTLAKNPGPASNAGTQEMPHHIRVFLQMGIPTLRQFELSVDPAAESQSLIPAELTLDDGVREQLVAAFGSPQAAVTLVVQRFFMAALPTGKSFSDGEPAYLDHQVNLEWTVPPSPLVLSDRQRARLAGGGGTQMRRVSAQFGDRSYSYWQDADQPERFYYLPDKFLLSRAADAPHRPELRLAVVSGDKGAERYSMEFAARPVTDERRLAAAQQVLAAAAAERGATKPVILDRRSDPQPVLAIALPRDGAPSPDLTVRPDTQIDLDTGLSHAETFTGEDFLVVYRALNGGSLTLLRGEVRVAANTPMAEDIPLELRLDRCAGEVLACTPDMVTAGVTEARLTNVIESPVVIRGLRAAAVGATRTALKVEGLEPNTRLAPGASCAVRLTFTGTPGDAAVTIDLGQSDVLVEPDRQAIWDLVFDNRTEAKLTREVHVRAVAEMFVDPARPGDEVLEFRVSIEKGDPAVVTRANLEVTTKRRVPIIPVLTGENLPPWRYRTETVWKSTAIGLSDWRESDFDDVFPVRTAP